MIFKRKRGTVIEREVKTFNRIRIRRGQNGELDQTDQIEKLAIKTSEKEFSIQRSM